MGIWQSWLLPSLTCSRHLAIHSCFLSLFSGHVVSISSTGFLLISTITKHWRACQTQSLDLFSLYSFYLISWLDYRLKYHFISDSKINISNLDPPVPTKLQTSKIHLNLVSNKHFNSLNATKTDLWLSAPYSKPAFFMIFPISILFF